MDETFSSCADKFNLPPLAITISNKLDKKTEIVSFIAKFKPLYVVDDAITRTKIQHWCTE